ERDLALRPAARRDALAAIEARAEAVDVAQLLARTDAVVDSVVELHNVRVAEVGIADVGENRSALDRLVDVDLQRLVSRARAESFVLVGGRQLYAPGEIEATARVGVPEDVVGRARGDVAQT